MGSVLRQELPDFATVELDLVRVVGRDRPESIFALLGDETLAIAPDFVDFAKGHAAMLVAYRARDWKTAERLLDELQPQAEKISLAALHAMYRERIAALRQQPPPDEWGGVFVDREKGLQLGVIGSTLG